MSVAVLEQTLMPRPRAVFQLGDRETAPGVRLPLRADVFLIAHDDDTGRCLVDMRRLCRGLAGAILLELWLTRRVSIGLRYDARYGRSHPESGVISIVDPSPVNDPLTDTAMAFLHRSGAMTAKRFVDQFATADLYERVRADMIATGVLQRGVRRRFGLFKRRTYLAIDESYVVRARNRVRKLVEPDDPRDPRKGVLPYEAQTEALAGIITGLGITKYLYALGTSPRRLHNLLVDRISKLHNPTVRDVASAINPRKPIPHVIPIHTPIHLEP